ncbi:MAG TPA: GntR family transcriptional regulator, partial [Clostridiales bacterium]|nr:GntR family transcriptional regulator [Clostridiales bacterium]
LKQKICELAAIGQLRPNDQLPSVRSFARELGINPNTVQKAYQELEREGIIYSVTGKGSFLSTKLDLDAQLHQQYLQKIAQATSLAKQCGIPLQLVLETVRKVYEEDQNE